MRVYWDTSALLWYYGQGRMAEIHGVTRSHSLAEAFSALSGAGIQIQQADGSLKWKKLSPLLAAQVVARLHACLEYYDLAPMDVITRVAAGAANRGSRWPST